MAVRHRIVFYLNGQRHEVGAEHAGTMLPDYLRYERGLVGTKIVCAEGDCGTCSVLRLSFNPGAEKRYIAINSCITTVAQMDGSSLVTIDALATPELTPVQRAMVSCHGSQCGFCTPGFVVALTGLVERKLCEKSAAAISERDAKNATTGNLCRCTGYQPIIDAATGIKLEECASVRERFHAKAHETELRKALATPLELETEKFSFYAPVKLRDAAAYLRKHRDARVVSGGTDLGVVHNKWRSRYGRVVSLHLVPSLYEIEKASAGRLRVGARVTLSQLRRAVKASVPELARFLDLFASPQIKNVATLAGNVANASPIADTPPFLLVANATVHVFGPNGEREIALEKFFLDYRKTALKPGEVIVAIEFDQPPAAESLALYKISQRKDLDISAVNAAFRVTWADEARTRVKSARLALGGVAAVPLRLTKTEALLKGAAWDDATVARAAALLQTEITPLGDLRGSAAFRRVLAGNLFERFVRETRGGPA